jgi:hypothetical protein
MNEVMIMRTWRILVSEPKDPWMCNPLRSDYINGLNSVRTSRDRIYIDDFQNPSVLSR